MPILKLGSRGPNVKLIQSLLKNIGYDPGPVDGIFGNATQRAVTEFQKDNNLIPDGIIGPKTLEVLNKLLLGYDTYIVKRNDTIFDIARRYFTSVNSVLTANPNINPNNLQIGQTLIVPYGIDVVQTDIDYTYSIMERDIQGLKTRYPFIQVGVAGQSVLGKNLYYIRLGRGPNEVFYNASHHALEWITTPLLMKFIENFSKAYASGGSIRGYNIPEIWNRSSIYLIPMVNPDGVDLVLEGLQPDNPFYEALLQWNDTGLPFSKVWKANIRGVDLNRNYPASWTEAKAQEPSLGVYGPGPTRFGGPYPLSEPETRTLTEFTRKRNFKLTISYHTQGRVIYWLYKNIIPPRSFEIAQVFSRASGYELSETPYEAAYAGYKDWFIEEFFEPGYTIEAGLGVSPLPISQFDTIYNNNEEIMLLAPII